MRKRKKKTIHLNEDTKNENFKKDLMNLTETNHQINMTFEILFQAITGLKAI